MKNFILLSIIFCWYIFHNPSSFWGSPSRFWSIKEPVPVGRSWKFTDNWTGRTMYIPMENTIIQKEPNNPTCRGR